MVYDIFSVVYTRQKPELIYRGRCDLGLKRMWVSGSYALGTYSDPSETTHNVILFNWEEFYGGAVFSYESAKTMMTDVVPSTTPKVRLPSIWPGALKHTEQEQVTIDYLLFDHYIIGSNKCEIVIFAPPPLRRVSKLSLPDKFINLLEVLWHFIPSDPRLSKLTNPMVADQSAQFIANHIFIINKGKSYRLIKLGDCFELYETDLSKISNADCYRY